jgi:hypothetical protein
MSQTKLLSSCQLGNKERGGKGDLGTRYSPQGNTPKDLLSSITSHPLQFHHLPTAIKLWSHKWINPLMRSEPSWSNLFPKVPSLNIVTLGIKRLAHERLGAISDLTIPVLFGNWLSFCQFLHQHKIQKGAVIFFYNPLLDPTTCELTWTSHSV